MGARHNFYKADRVMVADVQEAIALVILPLAVYALAAAVASIFAAILLAFVLKMFD